MSPPRPVTKNIPSELLGLVDRPIAYHRIFAEITGSAAGGVWLSQAVYWQPRSTHEGGWWYKSRREWIEETALTRRELEQVQTRLKTLHVLEVARRGMPCTTWFRLDLQALAALISSWSDVTNLLVQGEPTGLSDVTNQLAGNDQPTIPETTSKTPPEISTSRAQGARHAETGPDSELSTGKTQTPEAGGREVSTLDLEADPVLWKVVSDLVEATRHGDAPRDLRAVAVAAFRSLELRLHGPTLDAVVEAVRERTKPRTPA